MYGVKKTGMVLHAMAGHLGASDRRPLSRTKNDELAEVLLLLGTYKKTSITYKKA